MTIFVEKGNICLMLRNEYFPLSSENDEVILAHLDDSSFVSFTPRMKI